MSFRKLTRVLVVLVLAGLSVVLSLVAAGGVATLDTRLASRAMIDPTGLFIASSTPVDDSGQLAG